MLRPSRLPRQRADRIPCSTQQHGAHIRLTKGNLLARYARNEFSQFGEDGIIEKVLDVLSGRDNWCVEFGAWDGIHLSNTYNLIKNRGFKSVLIEADSKKFIELQRNLSKYEAVLINRFVTFEGPSTLDNLLAQTKIPSNFDFLSVDIDGNDYHVFSSIERYRPKLVCIEFNPTMPNDVEYVQPRDFRVKKGASPLSMVKLAKSKDYGLVACTSCNLFFVDQAQCRGAAIEIRELAEIRDDADCRVFAFVGYDGGVCLSQGLKFPWHGFTARTDSLQVLPRPLRRFIHDYNFVQKVLFLFFLAFRFPSSLRDVLKRFAAK